MDIKVHSEISSLFALEKYIKCREYIVVLSYLTWAFTIGEGQNSQRSGYFSTNSSSNLVQF
jgi:hypothetical protein